METLPSTPILNCTPSIVHDEPIVRAAALRLWKRLKASAPVTNVPDPMWTFDGTSPSVHLPGSEGGWASFRAAALETADWAGDVFFPICFPIALIYPHHSSFLGPEICYCIGALRAAVKTYRREWWL